MSLMEFRLATVTRQQHRELFAPRKIPPNYRPKGRTGKAAGVGTNCLQPAGLQTGAKGMPE